MAVFISSVHITTSSPLPTILGSSIPLVLLPPSTISTSSADVPELVAIGVRQDGDQPLSPTGVPAIKNTGPQLPGFADAINSLTTLFTAARAAETPASFAPDDRPSWPKSGTAMSLRSTAAANCPTKTTLLGPRDNEASSPTFIVYETATSNDPKIISLEELGHVINGWDGPHFAVVKKTNSSDVFSANMLDQTLLCLAGDGIFSFSDDDIGAMLQLQSVEDFGVLAPIPGQSGLWRYGLTNALSCPVEVTSTSAAAVSNTASVNGLPSPTESGDFNTTTPALTNSLTETILLSPSLPSSEPIEARAKRSANEVVERNTSGPHESTVTETAFASCAHASKTFGTPSSLVDTKTSHDPWRTKTSNGHVSATPHTWSS